MISRRFLHPVTSDRPPAECDDIPPDNSADVLFQSKHIEEAPSAPFEDDSKRHTHCNLVFPIRNSPAIETGKPGLGCLRQSDGNATALIISIVCSKARFCIQLGFGRLTNAILEKSGIHFKWKTLRPTGGQLALDAGVPTDMISRMMRHSSVLTTERYYCRARADLAYARVNDAYNGVFAHEPAITEKSV